jgi:LmbE family N-acetylglucosaminyl deacetylase
MAERIASIIAIQKPGIIMTWGPDGGYGHADHRMVSNVVTQVVQAMGVDRPDLLYAALPSGEQVTIPGFENWATVDPLLATDRLQYELPDLDATRSAIDCHTSQFEQSARAMLPELLHQNVWRGAVYFRLALPRFELPH